MTTTMLANTAQDLWVDEAFCRNHHIPMKVGVTFEVPDKVPAVLDKVWLPVGEYQIVQTFEEHGFAEVAKIEDGCGDVSLLHFIY